jgi:hypothetical protein
MPIWQKRFGAGQSDQFNAATATPDGGFVAVGETRSFGAESSDIFVVKVDASGNTVWNRIINSGSTDDFCRSVIILPDGGFILTGMSFPIGSNSAQTIVTRLTSDGNTVWSKSYSSSVGNIFLCNYVQGNVIYASGGLDADAVLVRLDLATGVILGSRTFAGSDSEALYFQLPTQDGNMLLADHGYKK